MQKLSITKELCWQGFIERHGLLKERLYCRTGPNCPGLYKLSELSALSDSLLCPHCLYCLFYLYCPHHLHCLVIETLMKLRNLVKIAKFGQNCKIWLKLQNLVNIAEFGQNCQIWSKLQNGIFSKFWNLV